MFYIKKYKYLITIDHISLYIHRDSYMHKPFIMEQVTTPSSHFVTLRHPSIPSISINSDNIDHHPMYTDIPNGVPTDTATDVPNGIPNGVHTHMPNGASFKPVSMSDMKLVQREKETFNLKPDGENKLKQRITKFLDTYFMLIGLIVVVILADKWPIGHNDGILHPQITSGWIVTIILFFGLGLGFKITYLRRACLFWQMNVFCHLIIFVYFPLIGLSIKLFILYAIPPHIVSDTLLTFVDGTIILCCLPATAASAVVLTHNARGNEAAAAINCTAANLLGLFLTPLLIVMFMDATDQSIHTADIFLKLTLRILLPFFLAQLIRYVFGRQGQRVLKDWKIYIRKMNEFLLLYMVFCALSESFYTGWNASSFDIFCIVVIILFLHCHSYIMIWYLASITECCMFGQAASSSFLTFTIYDRIGMMYSGASKTLLIAIPLIEIMYGGNDHIGMYIVPVLLYKPISIIVGSLLVSKFRRMVGKERTLFLSMTSSKENRIAYETFISNLSDQTDYGALKSLDLQTLSHMSDWDMYMKSEGNKPCTVDGAPRLMLRGQDKWDPNLSNYVTLIE
eukprot:372959_1